MDSKLRHLLLGVKFGIIEIAIRAKIAYEYGHDYGNTAYYLDITTIIILQLTDHFL